MVIMIVTAVVMVLGATVAVFYSRWVKKPELPSAVSGMESRAPDDELDIDAVEPKVSGERRSKEIYTILVVGTDTTSSSTDTMMLVTYDVTNQRSTVMSIPRDTLVNVNSGNRNGTMLNSIYNLYGRDERGMEALTREVSELVGFTPDFKVFIDWELVGEMVDAIGGVEYDVPYHMEYFDPYQDLNIYIEKGLQVLDGAHAMQLVRWRHNNAGVTGGGDGSDINRLKVQQGFLKAVLKKTLRIQNVVRIGQLAELFGKRVDSDLTIENLFWFGSKAIFGGLNADNVEFVTMPHLGISNGQSRFYGRVFPDQIDLLELINESLNPFVDEVTIRELDLIRRNANDTLSSTTGVLADPRWGQPAQTVNTPAPGNNRPIQSMPVTSEPPVVSELPTSQSPGTEPLPTTSEPIQESDVVPERPEDGQESES